MITEEESKAAATKGLKLIAVSIAIGFILAVGISRKFIPDAMMGEGLLLWYFCSMTSKKIIYWIYSDEVARMKKIMDKYMEENKSEDPPF